MPSDYAAIRQAERTYPKQWIALDHETGKVVGHNTSLSLLTKETAQIQGRVMIWQAPEWSGHRKISVRIIKSGIWADVGRFLIAPFEWLVHLTKLALNQKYREDMKDSLEVWWTIKETMDRAWSTSQIGPHPWRSVPQKAKLGMRLNSRLLGIKERGYPHADSLRRTA